MDPPLASRRSVKRSSRTTSHPGLNRSPDMRINFANPFHFRVSKSLILRASNFTNDWIFHKSNSEGQTEDIDLLGNCGGQGGN